MTTRGNNTSLTRKEIDTIIKEAVDSVVGRLGKTVADAIKKEINKKKETVSTHLSNCS